MERVSIISGKLPILIVAPHGFNGNDENTAIIAEHIAKRINAYAVINRGWERNHVVDFMLDKADCNNVNHCLEDVVKEEFLDPIIRYKNKILKTNQTAYIYYIHGMGNKHRDFSSNKQMDAVIGYGRGSPNSFTCELWKKDLLCHLLNESGINTLEGRSGGLMSGWAKSNMNQLFRKWYYEPNVQSMQIEIVHELRSCPDISAITAEFIAIAMKNMLTIQSFNSTKSYKSY